jgi:aconitate hydratase
MPQTLTYKILSKHLLAGELAPGSEIGLRMDQTLTQDATGTTAFLLLEAMGVPRVRAELSVSYVDHNMAQFGPENANDHLYLQTVAARLGAWFSRPGNGICHQVHLERFARPGRTLIGSDSHTPTAGGMGSLAIGAGGLDVAVAMGGGAFYTTCPRVIGVELRGRLRPWVSAKDIILCLLGVLTTRGNVGCVVEYFGEGVAHLPVPARATCANMGAELGATTSLFPADEMTRRFLTAQKRGRQYAAMTADAGAVYDRITKKLDAREDAAVLENINRFAHGVHVGAAGADGMAPVSFEGVVIDLSQLEPLAACPSSPDHVAAISSVAGRPVRQVAIGSCTNSSYQDLMIVAAMLRGRTVHPDVELGIAPGSRQVLKMLTDNGALAALVSAGARILESACGPCIGVGFSPPEGGISVRTFNRNFAGRSGTRGDAVFLVSPESAAAAALAGKLVDPRDLAAEIKLDWPAIQPPEHFEIDDRLIIAPPPPEQARQVEVVRGSTIVKPPAGQPLPDRLDGRVLIRVGDKVTTDHIMPAGELLKHRSNVPQYARYVFNAFNVEGRPTFAQRALELKQTGRAGFIVAGDSYGQGSSREHAALCPMYLGVRAVIAKAIERIHQANLVNFAILPLTFADAGDYDRLKADDELVIEGVTAAIGSAQEFTVSNRTAGTAFTCRLSLAPRQRKILLAGGLLSYTRDFGL